MTMRRTSRRRNPMYEDMRFSRGVLQTPEGPIRLKKIGKGAFSTAYVEVREDALAPRVFVFSGSEVVDKELLAMARDAAPNNPHLPKVERFGNVGDMNVYVMPLYNSPFRKADSPQGWKDFSAIKKCREQAWEGVRKYSASMLHRGYDVNFATVECAKASGVRPAVVEALDVLTDTASNYGSSQVFEFAPRNLATDDAGNLVFLDPLFDMEQLERQRAEARRRAAAASRMRWNPRRPVAGRRPVVGRRPPRLRNPQIDIQPLEAVSQENISEAIRAYRPVEDRGRHARIRKAKEILRRRGYALTGPALGTGTMATVFALEEYPDYVAKLTYDPTDAALMAEMAQIERKMEAAGKPMPAGLPKVITVAALGSEDDPLGLYLIVIERLVSLNPAQKKRVSSLAKKLSWGSLADTEAGDTLWEIWKTQKKSPEYALLNAARTVHALGYIPYDLDAQNTMQRADGTIVVSDFGYSAPRRGTRTRTVARLRNPAGGVYDAYDFVVKASESSQQFWEPTGEGAGVRPVRYAYTRLQVRVSERGTGRAVGGVGGASEERSGTRVRLKDGSCERDFAALAARHPGLRGVIVVTSAALEEDVRGKGVGLAMYRLFAQEAGRRGFAVVPEECWSGTALTSADAKRVWAKLAREPGMDAEGRVVYAPPRGV